MPNKSYEIVGHRGWPQKFPENSIAGVAQALSAGVHAEIDVQLSADLVPLVIHDANTLRTSGIDRNVLTSSYAELSSIVCDEEQRFGKAMTDAALPRLHSLIDSIADIVSAEQRLFVEIKSESIDHFGIEETFAVVYQAIKSLSKNIVFISFHYDFLHYAQTRCDIPIGWVLEKFDSESQEKAVTLAPQFLAIDCLKIPANKAPWSYLDLINEEQGVSGKNWQWFVYDVCDPLQAQKWFERGIHYIESWDFKAL